MELTVNGPWFLILFMGMFVMGLAGVFLGNMVSFFTNMGLTVVEVLIFTGTKVLPDTLYVMFTVFNGALLCYSIIYIIQNWPELKDAR